VVLVGLKPISVDNWLPAVFCRCWSGHLTCKIVPEMIYKVSSGTLNLIIACAAYNEVAMSVHPSTYGHGPQRPQTAAGYQNYYAQPSAAGHPADSAGMEVEQTVAPPGVEHDWAGDSFSNKKIRLAFIRKVRRLRFPARILFYMSY